MSNPRVRLQLDNANTIHYKNVLLQHYTQLFKQFYANNKNHHVTKPGSDLKCQYSKLEAGTLHCGHYGQCGRGPDCSLTYVVR